MFDSDQFLNLDLGKIWKVGVCVGTYGSKTALFLRDTESLLSGSPPLPAAFVTDI